MFSYPAASHATLALARCLKSCSLPDIPGGRSPSALWGAAPLKSPASSAYTPKPLHLGAAPQTIAMAPLLDYNVSFFDIR